MADIEIPSGKDAAYENFPVGSWLLPAGLRPHIAVFYAFARAADDIADSTDLSAGEKVRRLDLFEAALLGRDGATPGLDKPRRMAQSLADTSVTTQHCVDLLTAFRLDATKLRYRDWEDLMAYCALSAAPVGRYLLDLHGGSKGGYDASDALCMALQVINHLQDCQDDYRQLDRVYLPQDWLEETGIGVDCLDASKSVAALRQVLDRMLDHTETLLEQARVLPGDLKSRRLAMEAGAIQAIARRLVAELRRGDPLARRIKLSKSQFLVSCCSGVFSALFKTGNG